MKLLTYKDAAEACQMSVAWIRKQVRDRKLPVVRFGRHPRISIEDLATFADKHREIVSTAASVTEYVGDTAWNSTLGKSEGYTR